MTTQSLTDTHEGRYTMTARRTLMWDTETDLGVLVEDQYTGEHSVEGGMYRPHLYTLTPELTRAAREAWDAPATEENGYIAGWKRFWYDNADRLQHGVRYYGDAEDALARHHERQTATA